MAHPGSPAAADSQMYVTLATRPDLDGYYAVFGQVIDGADVPAQDAARRRDHEDVRQGVRGIADC